MLDPKVTTSLRRGLLVGGWGLTSFAFYLGGAIAILTSPPRTCEGDFGHCLAPGIIDGFADGIVWFGAMILFMIVGAVLLYWGMRLVGLSRPFTWRAFSGWGLAAAAWLLAVVALPAPAMFSPNGAIFWASGLATLVASAGLLWRAVVLAGPTVDTSAITATTKPTSR